MEEQAKRIAELLRLLANEHRLLILCALMEGPRTVGELHLHTPHITASALSQHLAQLRTAGILSSEKQGMNVVYAIRDERVSVLVNAIKEQYCTNHGSDFRSGEEQPQRERTAQKAPAQERNDG